MLLLPRLATESTMSGVWSFYSVANAKAQPFIKDGLKVLTRGPLRSTQEKRPFSTSAAKEKAKVYESAEEAIHDIPDGARVLFGGYGSCGVPENLIAAVKKRQLKDIVAVSNDAGTEEYGIGILARRGQLRRIVCSYLYDNKEVQNMYLRGDIEVEFIPQGSLVERIRSVGLGVPAFFTRTGYGTLVHAGGLPIKFNRDGSVALVTEPKEQRQFDGRNYILETTIPSDYALVKAWKADRMGNLVFSKSANNFNSSMSKSGKITIVEAEEIVEVGMLKPDEIHVSAVYVQRIVQGKNYIKPILKLALADSHGRIAKQGADLAVGEKVAKRVALEFEDGMHIILGTGLPTLAANYVPPSKDITIQSENGVIGIGPFPSGMHNVDPDLVNAGKETITVLPGAAYVGSDESFGMIRGGHIDLAVLSALQVSKSGDIANWIIPCERADGIGPAMDLVGAPKEKVIVAMAHTDWKGQPTIVEECNLPLSGVRCVRMIITEKAVFECTVLNESGERGLILTELSEDVSLEDLKASTGCDFHVSENLRPMRTE